MSHTNSKHNNPFTFTENPLTPTKTKVQGKNSEDVLTKKKTMDTNQAYYQSTIQNLQNKIKVLEDQNQKNKMEFEKKINGLMKDKNALEILVTKLKQKENPKENNSINPKPRLTSNNQLLDIENTIQMEHLKKKLTQAINQGESNKQQVCQLRRDNTQLMKMIGQKSQIIDKLKLENAYLNKIAKSLKSQLNHQSSENNTTSITRDRSSSSSRKLSAQKEGKTKIGCQTSDKNCKILKAELVRANDKVKRLGETIELINEQIVKNNLLDLNHRYRNGH